jgi:hypothetical protein
VHFVVAVETAEEDVRVEVENRLKEVVVDRREETVLDEVLDEDNVELENLLLTVELENLLLTVELDNLLLTVELDNLLLTVELDNLLLTVELDNLLLTVELDNLLLTKELDINVDVGLETMSGLGAVVDGEMVLLPQAITVDIETETETETETVSELVRMLLDLELSMVTGRSELVLNSIREVSDG